MLTVRLLAISAVFLMPIQALAEDDADLFRKALEQPGAKTERPSAPDRPARVHPAPRKVTLPPRGAATGERRTSRPSTPARAEGGKSSAACSQKWIDSNAQAIEIDERIHAEQRVVAYFATEAQNCRSRAARLQYYATRLEAMKHCPSLIPSPSFIPEAVAHMGRLRQMNASCDN